MKKINNECVRKKFKYRRKLYNHPAMFMFAGEKINLREGEGGMMVMHNIYPCWVMNPPGNILFKC